jgi:cobalt/nickel transport system permease protein
MGASPGHSHVFFVHAESGVHRLAPECKLVATVLFVFAVVATPREAIWAFALDALILVVIALIARVPLGRLARRLVIELPFLAFAVFLPFIGRGPYVQVGFLTLSEPGLWGAWNIVVKGTIGVAASSLLTATTTVPELLKALDRLRIPKPLVGIASFMVRYGEVLAGDLRRMRIARLSRGDDPRWLWQVAGVARTAGALFVRSYERGERVYIAMLARGYGLAPQLREGGAAPGRGWVAALTAPFAAGVICAVALAAAGPAA